VCRWGWLQLLFTTSDYDPFFSKGVLRGVAALIDGAEVVHFAGHGHSVYFEDPDGFNYAVMDFLQRVCPSSTAHPKDGWL
jgi:pimeloyl-ACP methyl ester carboxylesterase